MSRRVMLSWSSGKDSAWSLHILQQQPDTEVVALLTTVNTTHQRVAMHSTRRSLVEAQSRSVGIPLEIVPLPWPCSNEIYEHAMRTAIDDGRRRGATHIAFGDLYLEDVRNYRITQLANAGLEPLFPIWGEPTSELARRMIDTGLDAVLTCIDPRKLPRSFVGRKFDHDLLDELPPGVDPCGENGEFHTCVLDAPMFREPLTSKLGEIVERDGFCFADLIPAPFIADAQSPRHPDSDSSAAGPAEGLS